MEKLDRQSIREPFTLTGRKTVLYPERVFRQPLSIESYPFFNEKAGSKDLVLTLVRSPGALAGIGNALEYFLSGDEPLVAFGKSLSRNCKFSTRRLF